MHTPFPSTPIWTHTWKSTLSHTHTHTHTRTHAHTHTLSLSYPSPIVSPNVPTEHLVSACKWGRVEMKSTKANSLLWTLLLAFPRKDQNVHAAGQFEMFKHPAQCRQVNNVHLCPPELQCFSQLMTNTFKTYLILFYMSNIFCCNAWRQTYKTSLCYLTLLHIAFRVFFIFYQTLQLTDLWKLFCLLSWRLQPPHGSKKKRTSLPVNVNRRAPTGC